MKSYCDRLKDRLAAEDEANGGQAQQSTQILCLLAIAERLSNIEVLLYHQEMREMGQ